MEATDLGVTGRYAAGETRMLKDAAPTVGA
jgi:hypothetical protein